MDKKERSKLFTALVIILATLLSCDLGLNIGGGKDDPDPPATEILGFEFFPNDTVAVGDSLIIKVIVRDSLDTNLRFNWSIDNQADKITDLNFIKFLIQEDSGVVQGRVNILP